MKVHIQFTPEEEKRVEPIIFAIMRMIPNSRTVCDLSKTDKAGNVNCYIREKR